MKLSSIIVAEPSQGIEKEAQCCLDHEYKIISRHQGTPLSQRQLEPYLISQHESSTVAAQCIIVYKFPLDHAQLMAMIREKQWSVTIWDYHPNHQKL